MSPYDKEIKHPFGSVMIRKLTVFDFICTGLKLSFFQQKKGHAGRFEQLQKQLEKNEDSGDFTQEQLEVFELVLKMAVRDYDPDALMFPELKAHIFSEVILYSNEKIFGLINPDKNLILACHRLAETYGGAPWDYMSMAPDKFDFNLHCLNTGLDARARELKALQKSKKGAR